MTAPRVQLVRRSAWRLAKAMAPDLADKVSTAEEGEALDQLLELTGPRRRVDWVELAFNSRFGGRFKPPGVFGALYAGLTPHAARSEAAFHWGRTLANASMHPQKGSRLALQVLDLKLTGHFLDVRKGHPGLHDPDSHVASQAFGFRVQAQGGDGIVHLSVRAWPRDSCAVVFRAGAVVSCVEAGQVALVWDGERFIPPPSA